MENKQCMQISPQSRDSPRLSRTGAGSGSWSTPSSGRCKTPGGASVGDAPKYSRLQVRPTRTNPTVHHCNSQQHVDSAAPRMHFDRQTSYYFFRDFFLPRLPKHFLNCPPRNSTWLEYEVVFAFCLNRQATNLICPLSAAWQIISSVF